MKHLLIGLLLFPLLSKAQTYSYYSGDASVQFAKTIDYTGYGLNISGNIEATKKLFVGVAAGAVKVKPLVSNPSFFANGRLTFFTSDLEEELAPFAMVEVGKIFYSEQNFGGQPGQRLEGALNFFTGVGVRLGAQKLHPFISIGYANFYYNNNTYRNNSIESSGQYRFQRVVIRAGVMLPR